jgi:excisionase family DNA binding protein
MKDHLIILQISKEELEAKILTLKSSILSELNELILSHQGNNIEYMTLDEVAQALKKSRTTIENWTNSGLLKKYRIGNSVFFRRSEIDQAMI